MYSLSPAEKAQQKTVGLDRLLPEPTVEGFFHLSPMLMTQMDFPSKWAHWSLEQPSVYESQERQYCQ
jgi:hypothetical protein